MLDDQKAALRTEMRARLAALEPTVRLESSYRIARKIMEMPTWRKASRVLLFAPLPTEPDLDLLWLEGATNGKQIAYPRVEGRGMTTYYVNALEELEPTRWGLREPPVRAAREAPLEDIEVVLVPGLAFDSWGGRLGRGGGFYDRFLATRDRASTRLIGVGFTFQFFTESLPLVSHDVRMDEVCAD